MVAVTQSPKIKGIAPKSYRHAPKILSRRDDELFFIEHRGKKNQNVSKIKENDTRANYEKHPIAAVQPSTEEIYRPVRRGSSCHAQAVHEPGNFSLLQKSHHARRRQHAICLGRTGKRYLDGLGGIVTISVGHCHPHVVAAANKQNELLQHSTTIYLQPNVALYAEKLASKMPGDLKVCYFVNSGSEANDLALLMARAATGNYDVIALRNGYHGGNASGMGVTAHSTWKYNVPHSFGVHHALAPYPYRGRLATMIPMPEKNMPMT